MHVYSLKAYRLASIPSFALAPLLALMLAVSLSAAGAQSPSPVPLPPESLSPAPQAASAPQASPAPQAPQDFEALGRTVVTELAARQFDKVEAIFDARVARGLPHGKLAEVWDQVLGGAGSFKSVRKIEVTEAQGKHVAKLTCDFEHTALALRLTFDSEGHIAALWFGPAESDVPWTPPAYANAAAFEEQPVTVGHDPFLLKGTLTLPKGKGPFPAVVLVQGSGATDEDESVGPNKPFKDLAWGLASQGIAVLRYNKRTFEHPESFKGQYTVEQESIEDAKAGVSLLAGRPEIDPQHIFVVGHSLGAMLGPRIAKEDPQVAGIVIMAGPTRPFGDLVVEQMKYEVGLLGKPTPQGDKQIAAAEEAAAEMSNPNLTADQTVDFLGTPLPGSYFLDLHAYDQAHTAAGLKIPILVLQGARDCQVRLVDFEGWKKALAGDPLASFHLYLNLYHLFIPVPASDTTPLSTPADYEVPGHVAPEVITDIAGWINSHSGRQP